MRWAGPTTSGPTHWPDAACVGFRQLAEGPLHAPGVCAAPQRSYSLKDSWWRCRVGRYSAFFLPYALPCALQNALQAMWRPRRRFLGLKGLRVLGAPWLVGGVNDLCAAYVDARLTAARTALAYRGGSE